MELRPYQREAIDALNDHLATKETNPCVVLPTGSGKSYVMASAIDEWIKRYPPFRCMVLAHRKELVQQNAAEFIGVNVLADVGIYSAGLNKHEDDHAITFAGIDSVWDKAGEFPPLDVVIVDEAHRIPVKGEGKYRRFLADAKHINPKMRVIGFTATPFRLGAGPICHRDHILNEICYEANVGDLIHQGWLCRLRSKCGADAPDLDGVKKSGGDYQQKALGRVMGENGLVGRTVADALTHLNIEERKCVVWFCVDVKHCESVANALRMMGENAPLVTGATGTAERDRIVDEFKAGKWRHLCNVNVFTEGFNVKRVDAIVLLRPTLSMGLYSQMVGRGLRLHPDKADCIVLDYARCIETHGPIDCLEAGKVRTAVCGRCREVFSRAAGVCPQCGWKIPKDERERVEREEKERRMHEERAAQMAILGSEPTDYTVDSVMVDRHCKDGSPDSLCVSYRSGIRVFREWVCLDHQGFAGRKAQTWWAERFGSAGHAVTVNEALYDMFLADRIKKATRSVTVVKRGKYWEIINHDIVRQGNNPAVDAIGN